MGRNLCVSFKRCNFNFSYAEWLLPYYNDLAQEGAEAGLLMFGHDHLGHGLSPGERAQIRDVSQYVQPVIDHCQYKKRQHPGVPVFIIGHSMGGLVAVLATLQTQVYLLLKRYRIEHF